MNAWVLTWEGTTGPAVEPDTKIVAILSSRKSSRSVEELIDVLYCRSIYSAHDSMMTANKKKERQSQFKAIFSQPSRMFYGRNPCIFARVVIDLTVTRDERERKEVVRWIDPAVFGNADSGSGVKEIYPSRECEVVRALRPLSLDIYGTAA